MKTSLFPNAAPLSKSALGEPCVPVWLKWTCSAFMRAFVPVYWVSYGPASFIRFCDASLFLALFTLACVPTHLAPAKLIPARATRPRS
jgi:hypothetical protein